MQMEGEQQKRTTERRTLSLSSPSLDSLSLVSVPGELAVVVVVVNSRKHRTRQNGCHSAYKLHCQGEYARGTCRVTLQISARVPRIVQ
jgi:hypothetical protein